MQVAEVMTKNVRCIGPQASLNDAARQFKELDVGSLPVCGENDRLVGIITDRDVVVRGLTEGCNPGKTKVEESMTPGIEYCIDDQTVEDAACLMRDKQIRRLAVLNRAHRLVGIVSLGDLAIETDDEVLAGDTLQAISEPVGAHGS